jgi:hypothetical protein
MIYIIFQREKVIKNQEESGFFLLFLPDDSRIRTSTNGSGSARPKNIQILRIRIRITGLNTFDLGRSTRSIIVNTDHDSNM